ncbi:IclR family transcriptional regulator [Microbacterium aerolatum]|uniref:IclR family transcriptional regulator n=1 Tax=Microbacterium aerolatum TaxID=153731 RepID=UPI003850ED25
MRTTDNETPDSSKSEPSSRPTLGQRSPIQTIDRTVDLITAIAAAGPAGVSLKELVEQAGLHASTGRTLLSALAIHGLVGQIDSNRRYVLGPRFFELNRTYQLQNDLSAVAAPVLRRLWERTDETVHLSTLQHGRRVDISVLVSRQLLNINPSNMRAIADQPDPLAHTAAGKVLLAGASPAELVNLTAHTENRAQLDAELAAVRSAGYATNFEEETPGVCGIAAPVRDHTGRVTAAICVGYPAARRSDVHDRALLDAVVESAAELSAVLGYSGGLAEERA